MRRASAALQLNFNPRSLTGATADDAIVVNDCLISIHAPLRERPLLPRFVPPPFGFQSTLPCGSDEMRGTIEKTPQISIHAPLRERHSLKHRKKIRGGPFQSTLPCGSDRTRPSSGRSPGYFNPRSLAGATRKGRQLTETLLFQSTLPCGSDC